MGSVSAKEMEVQPEYKVNPLLGFENGRKTRGILSSDVETYSAQLC